MTSHVYIASIEGYAESEIRAVVERIVESNPDTVSVLAEKGRDCLIVVKPNWVQEGREDNPAVWESVITHPQVVLAVVEVLAEKMRGRGTICLCDAPHTYASFSDILAHGDLLRRLGGVRRRWPGLRVEVMDLRREVWTRREEVIVDRRPNAEDPQGYVCLDLGAGSLLHGYRGEGRYYGADYDSRVVNGHHRGGVHEYLVSGTAMACDLFVNLPKMKTHKKTGMTGALKNLVGINGDKNWLPHHTEGCPATGGDEFPEASLAHSAEGTLKRLGRAMTLCIPGAGPWVYRKMRNAGKRVLGDSAAVIRNGNWQGNDTCWRMVLDLNRCLLYGNPDGTWREADDPKPCLTIVDGTVAGEGNGPLCPDPVEAGVLLAGTDPAAVDAAVCRLMGFNPQQVPVVAHAFDSHRWPIAKNRGMDEIRIFDGRVGKEIGLAALTPACQGGFVPHFGWHGIRDSRISDGLPA